METQSVCFDRNGRTFYGRTSCDAYLLDGVLVRNVEVSEFMTLPVPADSIRQCNGL